MTIPRIIRNKSFLWSVAGFVGLCFNASAQKGMPSRVPTEANVNSFYPQHVDFKEDLLAQLKVPTGFELKVYATGLGKPRMMAVGPDGSLYVTRRDQGDVLLLRDRNGDGRADEMTTVVSNMKGVHGILLRQEKILLATNKELFETRVKADGTLDVPKKLLDDLPEGGQHPNRTIAFGPDGMLYITVGSDCNDCNETNPEHATILRAKPDGSSRKVYARGLRNTVGFDWHPATGELWAMDMGTDWRGDEIPPEELNRITEGGDYGWPLVYADRQVDQTREDPLGTTKEEYAAKTQPSVLTIPAHSAPINLLFCRDNFSKEYQGDALVTLHGSWNRQNPKGYKIQRIRFENGQPAKFEDFVTGFLSEDGKTRFGRPAGLVFGKKGELYVSDDENGVIYRLAYQGTSPLPGPAARPK